MSGPGSEPERVDILIVDDRPTNLLALKGVLERPDYNIVLAASGADALAQVLRRDFAVILLDVAMPGMDGFQTAAVIKEREQSKLTPIIFVTASVYDMEHIFRGYTVGAVDYLRKPVDTHAVRSKVAVFVELHRQRRQIEHQAERLRQAELREQRFRHERTEAALRESESLYQLTFEHAPVGIGHLSPGGTFTRANRRLCELLGADAPERLAGASLASIAVEEERVGLGRQLELLRAGRPRYQGEHRLAARSGATNWAELTVSAFRDPARGELREFIVVLADATARKTAEVERLRLLRDLEDGIRARDDFLSLAAHELRTPLTTLRLQSQGLRREAERRTDGGAIPAALLEGRIARLDRASERLEELVTRLLDMSRLSVGALRLEFEDLDLVGLVEDATQRLASEAEHTGSTIAVRSSRPVTGAWDRLRVDQIVTNLVVNAIKYGAGKPIEVSVSGDDAIARIAVRDRGVGIPEDAIERIFERFERVAPLSHYGGFGLGLWIVRLLAEAHGGAVRVASRPGDGAEFVVELPLRPSSDLVREHSAGVAGTGPGGEERAPHAA